jgi:hypothetical protein
MSFSGRVCRMFGGAFHFCRVDPLQGCTTILLISEPFE